MAASGSTQPFITTAGFLSFSLFLNFLKMLSLWNSFLALSLVTQKVNFPSDISGKKQVKVVFKKTLLFQIAFNINRERGKREKRTQTAALEVLKACLKTSVMTVGRKQLLCATESISTMSFKCNCLPRKGPESGLEEAPFDCRHWTESSTNKLFHTFVWNKKRKGLHFLTRMHKPPQKQYGFLHLSLSICWLKEFVWMTMHITGLLLLSSVLLSVPWLRSKLKAS